MLGGCGTVTQGIHQDISISSTPPGARCDLTKPDGTVAGTVEATPGKAHVRKTKYDLLMTCKLAGYQDASTYLKSGIATGTYGNVILGGMIGWGIDSAVGADNEYPATAQVTFIPGSGPARAEHDRAADLGFGPSRHKLISDGRGAATRFAHPCWQSRFTRTSLARMRRRPFLVLAICLACGLSGCGAIVQGTRQEIAVTSTPAGAHCDLKRPNGSVAATVERTPETVRVRKTGDDLMLACTLAGYAEADLALPSDYGFAVFGNVVLGYGPGWAVDHLSGSDNQYPHEAHVTLVPASPSQPKPQLAPQQTPQPAPQPPAKP
ncbi:MAG: hypothetical protein JOZ72_14900 [Alphaproteobacteria bacterium]|nr:hypothetical protein [Alphaproteobacteria bacterium]